MPVKVVTKHCLPNDRMHMLSGSFRVGSLSEYWKQEHREGRLSDYLEGKGTHVVEDQIFGSDIIMPQRGIYITGLLSIGNGQGNLAIESAVDLHIFCSSIGEYRADRHLAILENEPEPGNRPTAFLTLDVEALAYAMTMLSAELGIAQSAKHKEVRYGDRNKVVAARDIEGTFNKDFKADVWELGYTKPPKHEHEEEYRFALEPQGAAHPLLTRDYPKKIQELFRQAIVDEGQDGAR